MMTKNPVPHLIALLAAGLVSFPAYAGITPVAAPQKARLLIAAAGDCATAGERVAASQGGQLAKSTPTTQNGKPVCVVVVLVPGRGGERPRRVEVAVPAQ